MLAPAFGPAGEAAPQNVAARPGVILHETHWQAGATDTILTFITSQHVLIVHADGRTLLDLEADRLVLLDSEQRSFRAMSLGQWEATLEAAIGAERAAAATGAAENRGDGPLPFEPVGDSTLVAGYACDRYHYFGQRTLLGVEETLEQQIWVARTLAMPQGAYEAYQRALGSIESIGMGGLLRRGIHGSSLSASGRRPSPTGIVTRSLSEGEIPCDSHSCSSKKPKRCTP